MIKSCCKILYRRCYVVIAAKGMASDKFSFIPQKCDVLLTPHAANYYKQVIFVPKNLHNIHGFDFLLIPGRQDKRLDQAVQP